MNSSLKGRSPRNGWSPHVITLHEEPWSMYSDPDCNLRNAKTGLKSEEYVQFKI